MKTPITNLAVGLHGGEGPFKGTVSAKQLAEELGLAVSVNRLELTEGVG